MKSSVSLQLKSILHKPDLLLVELTTHGFVCDVFVSPKTASCSSNNYNPWEDQECLLNDTREIIGFCQERNINTVLFITISPYFYLNEDQLSVFRNTGLSLNAILHADVPSEFRAIANYQTINALFDNLFVFHSECIRSYAELKIQKKLKIIPLPPALLGSLLNYPRKKRDINERKVILGFLGEIRQGKGFLEFIRLFSSLPFEIRDSFLCLFTGGVSLSLEFNEIRTIINEKGIHAEFVSEEVKGYGKYKAISDFDFANSHLRSDIIVLPYTKKPATDAFSGVFPDALVAGSVFIATEDSIMGSIIAKEKLGFTFSFDNKETLIKALNNSLEFLKREDIMQHQNSFLQNYYNGPIEDIVIRSCLFPDDN